MFLFTAMDKFEEMDYLFGFFGIIALGAFLTIGIGSLIIYGFVPERKEELAKAIWYGVSFLIIAGICIWYGIANYSKINEWKEYYASEKCEVYYDKIYSINRENETYGKFSLGCGTVSEKVYYYFYIKIENDTYALKKIENKNNVYIVETEDTHWCITQNKKANSDTIYYNIIVPKGTIIQSFNG